MSLKNLPKTVQCSHFQIYQWMVCYSQWLLKTVNHNQCYKSYIIIAVIIADEFAHHSCIPIKLLSVITTCPFQGMQCIKPPKFSDLVLLSFVLVFGPHSMKDKLKLGLLLQSVFSLPHFLFSGIQNIASFRMFPDPLLFPSCQFNHDITPFTQDPVCSCQKCLHNENLW